MTIAVTLLHTSHCLQVLSVLYFHFTRSHVIPISETVERTLFGNHQKKNSSDKCEYTSREHKIPLRSIYCLLRRKKQNLQLQPTHVLKIGEKTTGYKLVVVNQSYGQNKPDSLGSRRQIFLV